MYKQDMESLLHSHLTLKMNEWMQPRKFPERGLQILCAFGEGGKLAINSKSAFREDISWRHDDTPLVITWVILGSGIFCFQ